MHEKPRFGIALAGVGGCLCIAAGIVLTAPHEIAVPSVNGLPVRHAPSGCRDCRCRRGLMWQPLSPLQERRVRSPGVHEALPSDAHVLAQVDAPRAETVTAAPAVLNRQSSPGKLAQCIEVVNRQFPVPVVLSNAPSARGKNVAETGGRDRGPVTGALVTAGTHIGGGFRTVGRTLKRVF